jgi:hypothetical protein
VSEQQAESRDRDRVTIPGAVAWPAVGVLAVFIAGWLYTFAGAEHFSPWWLLVSVPVLALLGQSLAATQWPADRYGVPHERGGVWFARCCAVVAGSWLTWAGAVTPGAALPLLLLAALPLWLWFVILTMRAPRAQERTAERREEGRQIVQERGWRDVLDRAGCDDVVLTEIREHRAGVVLTVEPDPEAKRPPDFDAFAARARGIATQAAMHYRRTQGVRLPRNAVRPEPGRDDAEFLINITTRDVFEESTQYVPDYVPGSITNALDLGEYEDAARLLLELVTHMKIVGATGSGKSNLAGNLIARITSCADALVWVGATDKLVPLVWPWIAAWLEGVAQRPTLDYVAGQTPDSVLRMLRAAYKLMCDRNARLDDESKMRVSSREPAVFVIVEEVSHAVAFRDVIETHDGQDVTIPDLIKMLTQGGRSANVRVVLMSQFGINAGLGDRASEIIRNIPMRICLRTMEPHDGSRTLSGLPATVNTAALTNYSMFVQPDADVPRVFPAKAPQLEGSELIGEIAARHAQWRPDGIEPESELGPDYAHRWSPERLPEIALRVAARGWSWPTLREPVDVVDTLDPAGGEVPGGGEDDGVRPQQGGPDDGGTTVDTTAWTDADEQAFRDLLGGGPPDPPRSVEPDRGSGKPFDLSHFGEALDRMNRLADAMEVDHPPVGPDPDEPGPGRPVPYPLDAVVRWLDETDRSDDGWVRSAELSDAIGWSGPEGSFGRAMFPLVRSNTTNLPRSVDPQQRRGYPVRLLREAAVRLRFDDEPGPA